VDLVVSVEPAAVLTDLGAAEWVSGETGTRLEPHRRCVVQMIEILELHGGLLCAALLSA